MKGVHSLILAIGLGIVGALFNFAYLANKSTKEELVGFVGIRTNLQRGERLRADAIEEVLIPARLAGNLKNYAVLWSARDAEVDKRVSRNLPAGSLLLLDDMRSPPAELDFGKNLPPGVEERAWFVPVDLRRMVPALVHPGDLVTFVAPSVEAGTPHLAAAKPARGKGENQGGNPLEPIPSAESATAAVPEGELEMIGPFRVLSLGNRLTAPEVLQAAQIPQTQEGVMTIAVRLENGRLEPQAQRLLRLLEVNRSQPLVVMLHPRASRNP